MTVSYQRYLAHSKSGGFIRLLFEWRGSLYKLIYKQLFLFIIAYGSVSAVYRNILSESAKDTFGRVVVYCEALEKLIPLPFILGFYVTYILGRWWSQFQTIPWPDSIMELLSLHLAENKETDRMMLRTLMRYVNLSLILVLRSISAAVKRRFPKLEDLVHAGLMTTEELKSFRSVPNTNMTNFWIPSTWFMKLLRDGYRSRRFGDNPVVITAITKEFDCFRQKCNLLWSYDWLPIPLVYTQVVTLITYGYFLISLIGRQHIDGSHNNHLQTELDKYISIILVLQFLFFMGLLKVAEQLLNPFGDDEEDFELNWLIDRHIKISFLGADMIVNGAPTTLVKDALWDVWDISLPYPPGAEHLKKKTYYGGVAHEEFPEMGNITFADNFDKNQNNILTGNSNSAFSKTSNDCVIETFVQKDLGSE